MDPVTALGVAAAVVQFVQVGTSVTKRLVEYINASPGDVPKALVDVSIQLPLITKSLSTIKEESNLSKLDEDTRLILQGVVLGCLKLAQELDSIANKISPKPGESLNAKLKKVLSSLKNDNRISEIDRGLQAYIQVLILHQVVSPSEVPVAPPTDVTYYEVKEIRAEKAVRRPKYIAQLHEAFRQASRSQKEQPEYAVLTGKEGNGKTQLALEYCQEAHQAELFRAIFWLDASSPEALTHALENVTTVIRKTKAGSGDWKREWLNTYFGQLWHSWLLVLDSYEPTAFDGKPLMDLLPAEGHGAVLILTRTPHAIESAVEIRVHAALTKDDYDVWRREVSDALRERRLDAVTDALADGFDVNSLSADMWQDERGAIVQLAAECGFAEAVQLFLDHGANPNLKKGYGSVLLAASSSNDAPTLKVYLAYEDRTGYRMEGEDYTWAVAQSVENDRLDVLRILLKERGDYVDRNGRGLAHSWRTDSTLHAAAWSGRLEPIRILVDANKFPESPKDKSSILSHAARGGQLELIKYLLNEIHCDPKEMNHDRETALILAIRERRSTTTFETQNEIVSLLLDAGADPNFRSARLGATPLHLAAEKGRVPIIQQLLDRGADPSIETKEGINVLEDCLKRENAEVNRILATTILPDPASNKKYYNRLLFLAARHGDRVLAVQALKHADINVAHEKTGETPLLVAIAQEQLSMARMLVRKGASQTIADKQGLAPLLAATQKDMCLLIQDLGKAKDSPGLEETDKDGNTPLMIAAQLGLYQAVATLIDLGADRDAINEFGETAYDIAEESRNERVMAVLNGGS